MIKNLTLNSSLKLLGILFLSVFVTSCLPEANGSKLRKVAGAQVYKDNQKGCGEKYFVASLGNQCAESCSDVENTHEGTKEEVELLKKSASESVLEIIENSKGVCVDDVVEVKRPTNAFTINPTTCTCRNGKSDVVNDCDTFCAGKPNTADAIVYLDTTPSSEVLLNDKLNNLQKWCTVPIEDGNEAPQCYLKLWDGSSETYAPLNVTPNSNKATADITRISTFNKSYIASIVDLKSGASGGEFQIYRKTQNSSSVAGKLKITPISQYTCITYGGVTDTATGVFNRLTEARMFYYYAANENPTPLPPYAPGKARNVICHDEYLFPGDDGEGKPRLENIPHHFSYWDKTDPRFVMKNNKLEIDKLIEERYFEESRGSSATFGFFSQITYPNRPSLSGTSTAPALGFMMISFKDDNGKDICPTQTDFDGPKLTFNILKEFIPETEALYIAEKEAENILDNGEYKTVYGNMFITESKLIPVAFYYENGLKIKATSENMAAKTIHFYWPIDSRQDPLFQGNRKIYTIRNPNSLQGQSPSGIPTSAPPNDKRIGCVPKSS